MGRQLIVMTKPASDHDVETANNDEIPTNVIRILQEADATIEQVIQPVSEGEKCMQAEILSPVAHELSLFYRVRASDDRLDDLVEKLAMQHSIEAAFINPTRSWHVLPRRWRPELRPTTSVARVI